VIKTAFSLSGEGENRGHALEGSVDDRRRFGALDCAVTRFVRRLWFRPSHRCGLVPALLQAGVPGNRTCPMASGPWIWPGRLQSCGLFKHVGRGGQRRAPAAQSAGMAGRLPAAARTHGCLGEQEGSGW